MKRLHVHVGVVDLDQSIKFYASLFAAEPTVRKTDYAKWMLDDPRVNFAISTRQNGGGVRHLGIQVETPDELAEVYERLQTADAPVFEEGATTCCYAKSEKSWINDPQGVAWETFLTTGESTTYGGGGTDSAAPESHRATKPAECCIPAAETKAPEAPKASPCCGPRAMEQA
ncbi:MAG: VOC family protein [Hyphomonadaceae bacterium]|jgi:catechol 2,3-dioxygenase-like lactoylglutathione lyase family enzyme|nr:VOC family protein [Hyphomonadaceae bacterium]